MFGEGSSVVVVDRLEGQELIDWRWACSRREAAEVSPRGATLDEIADAFYDYYELYHIILQRRELDVTDDSTDYVVEATSGAIKQYSYDD